MIRQPKPMPALGPQLVELWAVTEGRRKALDGEWFLPSTSQVTRNDYIHGKLLGQLEVWKQQGQRFSITCGYWIVKPLVANPVEIKLDGSY
jgi:hypothetical protein